MAEATNYTKLDASSAMFSSMMEGFGSVTVMNARIYDVGSFNFTDKTAVEIRDHFIAQQALARLDTLKVANVTVEGPNKTVTGGQYSNPLIKFGKSARLEMQDALGNAKAIEAFGGAINEYTEEAFTNVVAMHITEDFTGPKVILGDSFFIDRKTGRQVKIHIIFYQVLPDSIFNLTQDAEGDATVFDMNADLLTTEIMVPKKVVTKGEDGAETTSWENKPHGVFYSIIDFDESKLAKN